uniref:Uncharacterized protein n=1 Tax=Kalanchoe fedtschenkoi TaxID=63787 RepID=A0A7N0V0B3_KALFE
MQAERQISLSCSHCSDEPTAPQRWREAEEQDLKEDDDDDVAMANGGSVFEFSFDCSAEAASSPISADQIFHNGRIKPTLPMYDDQQQQPDAGSGNRRKALRRLFIEERHSCPSLPLSSSSDDESAAAAAAAESSSELESVPAESYCVWKPKTASSSKETKKAEGSSSKRWRLKDLLLARSSSEREKSNKKDDIDEEEMKKKSTTASKKNSEAQPAQVGRKMALKEAGGEKRRSSYLPYRQELVGIFGNSGSGRNLHRF